MAEIQSVPNGFEVTEDGTHIETLSVVAATLRPYIPPAIAHIVTE